MILPFPDRCRKRTGVGAVLQAAHNLRTSLDALRRHRVPFFRHRRRRRGLSFSL